MPCLHYAEFVFALGAITAALERLVKEVRNLQRSEINALSEGFGDKQVRCSPSRLVHDLGAFLYIQRLDAREVNKCGVRDLGAAANVQRLDAREVDKCGVRDMI